MQLLVAGLVLAVAPIGVIGVAAPKTHADLDGRRHIYTVDDPQVLTLIQQIFAHIAPDGSLLAAAVRV